MKIILIVVTSVIGLIGWVTQKELRFRWKLVTVILILICAFAQYYIEREQAQEVAKSRWIGVLNPDNMNFEGKKIKKKLEFGWSLEEPGHVIEFNGKFSNLFKNARPGNKKFLQIFEELSIVEDRGKLEVSINFRNEKGDLVASLEQNEWKVSSPPMNFDRNYTNDILEVIDEKGQVRLQIRLLKDKVQLNGVLYGPNGYGMEIYPVHGKKILGQLHMLAPGVKTLGKIKPLFKYPSDLHLGELR